MNRVVAIHLEIGQDLKGNSEFVEIPISKEQNKEIKKQLERDWKK